MPGVSPGRINSLNFNNESRLGNSGAGTFAAPAWVEIDRVSDVDRSGGKQSTEVNIRASETTIVVYGNKSREISFTYYKKKGLDPVFKVLEKSFEEDLYLDVAMMEDDITPPNAVTGTIGKRAPYIVSELNKSEPIDGVETYEVKMNFADAEQAANTPFLWQDYTFTAP